MHELELHSKYLQIFHPSDIHLTSVTHSLLTRYLLLPKVLATVVHATLSDQGSTKTTLINCKGTCSNLACSTTAVNGAAVLIEVCSRDQEKKQQVLQIESVRSICMPETCRTVYSNSSQHLD